MQSISRQDGQFIFPEWKKRRHWNCWGCTNKLNSNLFKVCLAIQFKLPGASLQFHFLKTVHSNVGTQLITLTDVVFRHNSMCSQILILTSIMSAMYWTCWASSCSSSFSLWSFVSCSSLASMLLWSWNNNANTKLRQPPTHGRSKPENCFTLIHCTGNLAKQFRSYRNREVVSMNAEKCQHQHLLYRGEFSELQSYSSASWSVAKGQACQWERGNSSVCS